MLQLLHEIKAGILGPVSIASYVVSYFFSGLALLLSLYAHSTKRDPLAPTTPYKFSWRFLIMDNIKRIAAGQGFMFFVFRFTPEIVGRPLTPLIAAGVGVFLSYGVDKAIQFVQKKTAIFDSDRSDITTPLTPCPPKNN